MMRPSRVSFLFAACCFSLALGCSGEEAAPVDNSAVEEPHPAAIATVTSIEGELWQGETQLQVGAMLNLEVPFEVRKGRAVIEIPETGTVRLYPGARFSISAARRIKLFLGKIWVSIIPNAQKQFEVETENAVAGVRGTEFVVAREGASTKVMVASGKVAVHNVKQPEKQLVLDQGQQSEVKADEAPTPPASFEAATEQKAWETIPTAPADDAGAPADEAPVAPEAPKGPRPGVKVDRKAMEQAEQQGEAVKENVKKEAQEEKKELQEEEKKTKESFEGGRETMEKDLEGDMGRKGSLKPKKDDKKMKKDSDVEDMLR